MRLILARHGESVWNQQGIIQGHFDSPLTALGERQVAALSQSLACLDIRHIYSSPAIRAVASAEQLAQRFQCQITLDTRLQERHYGELQGRRYDSLGAEYQERAAYPHVTPPEGESINDVCERSLSFINQLHTRHSQQTLLLVTHGDVLAVVIWALKGRQNDDDLRRYSHRNASFTTLELTENGILLVNWGVGTHLLKVT